MKNKSILFVLEYILIVITILVYVGINVIKVDPFFHYHKPDVGKYYYRLNNQRSQNDGILKFFDYDAIMVGSSMTENFSTTEIDSLFGVKSVKTPFSGGRYKEINTAVETGLMHNTELKTVFRCLDLNMFAWDKDEKRTDLGEYPTYLYDVNIFNDVKYIFNRDVVFNRTYPMIVAEKNGEPSGIDDFDSYSTWEGDLRYGMSAVSPKGIEWDRDSIPEQDVLTEEDKQTILGNIRQNVTSLPQKNPDVKFYYFFSPYSAVWWNKQIMSGKFYYQIEAEKIVIEELLDCDNVKLFSFNNATDITTNMDNYKDTLHYGEWINSQMLEYMNEGKYQITKDNYISYLEEEKDFYLKFDYSQLNE